MAKVLSDRLKKLRVIVDSSLDSMLKGKNENKAFIHLYGVSEMCVLLALKRGEDMETACISGLLHDFWSFKNNQEENHAYFGSVDSKEILTNIALFNEGEINKICQAIQNHSDKKGVHDKLDEILKDADVTQHFLNRLNYDEVPEKTERVRKTLAELGIQSHPYSQ